MTFEKWWKKNGIELATVEEKAAALKGWNAAMEARGEQEPRKQYANADAGVYGSDYVQPVSEPQQAAACKHDWHVISAAGSPETHQCLNCGELSRGSGSYDVLTVPQEVCPKCIGLQKQVADLMTALTSASGRCEDLEEIAKFRMGLCNQWSGVSKEQTELNLALTKHNQILSNKYNSLRAACSKSNDEISQVLGKALGYPWFKDDQKIFPGATEANGVCVGAHTAETIADEAAVALATKNKLIYDCAVAIHAAAVHVKPTCFDLFDTLQKTLALLEKHDIQDPQGD